MKLEECQTLADRLKWVLEHRAPLVKNARQWGRRAGLSPALVSSVIARNGGMTTDSAKALAAIAQVSLDWLVAGAGTPDGAVMRAFPQGTDPFPRRRIAATKARKMGVPPAAIHRVVYAARFNTAEHSFWKSAQWVAAFLAEWSEELVRRAAAPDRKPKKTPTPT